MKRRKTALIAALFAMIIAQTGCGNGTATSSSTVDPVTKQSFYFDTVCQITIYDMDDMSEENAAAAIDEIFAQCAEYEHRFSKTIEGTDIWNLNHAAGEPVTVDATTIDLVQLGVEYGNLTDGQFDITIGQAADLWDFTGDNPHVPDVDALAEAVTHVDYQDIVIDEEAGTIQLTDPEAEVDLGGIAKGYIADRIREYMDTLGVKSAIISLGGNIETCEGKPSTSGGDENGQQPFVIGIETPYSDGSAVVGSVEVTDGTVVTSGVYERYFVEDGQEYHHILNPETGYPVDSDVLGVSIVSQAGKSADCDALSTTCLILGSEKGKELIESLDGYEAVFITRDNEIVTTSGMNFTPID